MSEDALSGVGEECSTGVYPVCPGQFLPGQAGVDRNMRVDLSAGWDGMRKSPHNDEESVVDESDVTGFSQKLDNICKTRT